MNHLSRNIGRLLVIGSAVSCLTVARAITVDYGTFANPAAPDSINFTGGGNFSFSVAPNFQITNTDASDTSIGFMGSLMGTYHIDSTIGTTSTVSTVGGGNVLAISDGVATLSGTLNWLSIGTLGTAGGLNTLGVVNLTGITYGGTNPDLIALRDGGIATVTLTFQFTSPKTLADLSAGGLNTSFSGSMTSTGTVPDGGATVMMLGFAVSGLAWFRRRTV